MFGDIANSQNEPSAGKLLLSEPFLGDSNFKRSVVLLCEHTEEASLGFILNRKLELHISDVLELSTELIIPLHLGGPVQRDTLHFIHCDPQLAAEREIAPGIYWGENFDPVLELLENNTLDPSLYRFFLGYSGWGTGQLAEEMKTGSWIVTHARKDIVFAMHEEEMWKNILKKKGGSYKVLSNSPESPLLN